MNTEALFLFLILLLGLLLCSFLGGNCGNEGFTGDLSGIDSTKQSDNNNNNNNNNNRINKNNNMSTNGASTSSNVSYDNYNHFNGESTQLANGTTFYGENGGSLVVNTDSNGQQSLQVTLANGEQPMTFSSSQQSSYKENYTNYYGNNGTATTFYGPSGATATVVNGDNGHQAINVQTSSGSYTYTQSGSNPDKTTSTQYYGSTGTPIQQSSSSLAYQESYGGSAGSVTGPQGNTAYYAQGPNGNTVVGTSNNSYTGSANSYQGPYGGSAGSVTGPQGNSAYYAQGPNGNTVAGTSTNEYNDQYYNSLPDGISRSQIPSGQEDLYILKSQVVPPVCPACPVGAACPRQEKCPPCPACARCPEPSFECKKVPNYNAIGNDGVPTPVLSDFSSFGM
jgi:hypothetical protein